MADYDDLRVEYEAHIPGTDFHFTIVMSDTAMYHFVYGPAGWWVMKASKIQRKGIEYPKFSEVEDEEEYQAVHRCVHPGCGDEAAEHSKLHSGMVM